MNKIKQQQNSYQLKHLVLSQEFRQKGNSKWSFHLLDQFDQMFNTNNQRISIIAGDLSFNVIQGNNLYQWGFDESKFQIKNERNVIADMKQVQDNIYLLNKNNQCYKLGSTSMIGQNVVKMCKFQQHLFLLHGNNQLTDQNRNIVKTYVDDIVASEQFIIIQTMDRIQMIGNFPYQDAFEDKLESIACGLNHVLCLTKNQILYGWGEGIYGQLGNCQLRNQHSPITMASQVNAIECGLRSSVYLKQNRAYWCGTNEKLQKQSKFIEVNEDCIFISIHHTFSENLDIIYAQTLNVESSCLNKLSECLQKYQEEEDELLIPDSSYFVIKTESSQQSRKTPIKKLKFI